MGAHEAHAVSDKATVAESTHGCMGRAPHTLGQHRIGLGVGQVIPELTERKSESLWLFRAYQPRTTHRTHYPEQWPVPVQARGGWAPVFRLSPGLLWHLLLWVSGVFSLL